MRRFIVALAVSVTAPVNALPVIPGRSLFYVGAFLLSAFCSLPCSSWAATYYVSKSGNNSRSCGQAQTSTTPLLTINAGIGCLSAGDTLLVRTGDYDEGIARVPSGTSWSNKVRIAAYPGDTVWLRPLVNRVGNPGEVVRLFAGSYVEFDGINMDGRNVGYGVFDTISDATHDPHHFRVMNAELIASKDNSGLSDYGQWGLGAGGHGASSVIGGNEFINLTIHGGGRPTAGDDYKGNGYGIYISGPNNLVENCDIYDTNAAGIHIYNDGGAEASNNIIRNNRIHDITRTGQIGQFWGILNAGSNNLIYNNVIYNMNDGNGAGHTILLYSGTGTKVYNNTIYNNNQPYAFGTTPNAIGSEIKNNIVYLNTGSFLDDQGSGTVLSSNLSGTNPQFVNAAAHNFQLQCGSPAKDAGTSISWLTTDIAGTPRPQGSAYDIGAYELGSESSGCPIVGLSPVSLSFGNTAVGGTSAMQYVTVSNTGTTTLNLSNVVFSGDFAPAGLGTCGVTVPVPAGGSCLISVIFSPTAPGVRTGSILLTDNASPSAQTITLSGTGGNVSACDINQDAATNVTDVQLCVNQAIGSTACGTGDINHDSQCNVVDVQRDVNAALGGICVTQ